MPPGSRPAALSVGAIAEFLSSTALFRNVDHALIDKVAPHLPAAEHDAGATIVRAGSPDTGIGVLVAGRAAVRQVNASTGAATVLEELRIGDFFGEVALLTSNPRNADVVAVSYCELLVLRRRDVRTRSRPPVPPRLIGPGPPADAGPPARARP